MTAERAVCKVQADLARAWVDELKVVALQRRRRIATQAEGRASDGQGGQGLRAARFQLLGKGKGLGCWGRCGTGNGKTAAVQHARAASTQVGGRGDALNDGAADLILAVPLKCNLLFG